MLPFPVVRRVEGEITGLGGRRNFEELLAGALERCWGHRKMISTLHWLAGGVASGQPECHVTKAPPTPGRASPPFRQ